MVKKVLEYLVDYLVYNKFDTFFLVTGGAIAPVVDYIGQKQGAKYYCFHHEQAAAMAAEGYYRTTGKLPIILSTSGPGAQNLLNGICGMWYESIPGLFITGQVSTKESITHKKNSPRQLGFQETPIVDSFKPFTKYIKKVTNARDFGRYLDKALEKTFAGRMGPVLLDIPVDIQMEDVEYVEIGKFQRNIDTKFLKYEWGNKNIHIKNIIEKLNTSERPLLLIGHGVRLSGAEKIIKQLIKKLNIPFVVSWGGFDIMPHDHPLFVGDIGVYGSRGGNLAIQNCDFLLSIGSRLDTRQTGGNKSLFSRKSFKVIVDIDKNELKKNEADIKINMDVKHFINIFNGYVNDYYINNSFSEWNNYIDSYKKSQFNIIDEDARKSKNKLSSYDVLSEISKFIKDDTIIIPDQGGNLVWSMQSFKPTKNQRIFSNFGNSSMGWGICAAIGAAIGNPDKQIICIEGDGGIQMNIQELATIKRYNLKNIKIIILNNNSYGIIKQFQDQYFKSRYIASEGNDYSSPDFEKIAHAYDLSFMKINNKDTKEKIKLFMDVSDYQIADIEIDPNQKLIPKLEFGNPLEDMSPYLNEEYIYSLMLIDKQPRFETKQNGWVNLKK